MKITRTSLSDRVAAELQAMIRSGEYKPGDIKLEHPLNAPLPIVVTFEGMFSSPFKPLQF